VKHIACMWELRSAVKMYQTTRVEAERWPRHRLDWS